MVEPEKSNSFMIRGKLWLRNVGVILIVLMISMSVAIPISAELFYTGNIEMETLSAEIDITDNAKVNVVCGLVNSGDTTEAVNLTVSPLEATALIDGLMFTNPVNFSTGQQRELTLSYSIEVATSELKSITFNPMLYFNDMVSSHRIGDYSVSITFPEGIERIVSSSKPYDNSSVQDGRLVLTWQKEDAYPSSLNVNWTTLAADISVVKEADPDRITGAGEVVEVQITIQNQGDEEVHNIEIVDSFFPGSFEAIQPLDEFELVESEISDPHLYWKREIGKLLPGETESFNYSIKILSLGMVTSLDPLIVLVDGIPVSVSNEIILYEETSEDMDGWAPRFEFSLRYLVIGILIAVAIIGGVVYYRRRSS